MRPDDRPAGTDRAPGARDTADPDSATNTNETDDAGPPRRARRPDTLRHLSPALGEVLWTPPADVLEHSRIGDYLRWLRDERGKAFADYTALWRWSVEDLPGFWGSVWDYWQLGGPYDTVVRPGSAADSPPEAKPANGNLTMPGAEWFPGATVNYAERMLRTQPDDETVVFGRSQTRDAVDLTGAELRDAVARARAGLVRLGVGRGDRVAAYLPNVPEALILLLATASLGAVFSSCAPEFGSRSVIDRWRQIEPVVLVAVDGYRYGGKEVSRLAEVAEIRAELPSLRHVVGLRYLGADLPDALGWDALLAESGPLTFAPVPFGHPLYILYSSGTTGLPKPIVHGHGGILAEHAKTLALHLDLGPGDRFFWFTTTGWMMWNFLVSGLIVGSAVVLVDGDPGYPDLGHLWRLAADCGVTFFGTSAPLVMACRKAGLIPTELADVSAIRGVGSTGAPLPPEGFGWVYDAVGSDVFLQSFSGGTDLCTGFVGGTPWLPVHAGELSCPCLGAAVAAYNSRGEPVVGELGELVLERPMPSMPVGFWGDLDGSRYRAAYFEDFPGVWRHGDWIEITERGTCRITGRSDATLKRGGVRMGTAEFYSVVEGFPEVADSLVVHLERTDELLLFVVPSGSAAQSASGSAAGSAAEGAQVTDELRSRIAAALRAALSPRHLPDQMISVPEVPRTLSGKKLEVPVKRILEGESAEKVASSGALQNPDSLQLFRPFVRG